MKYLKWLLVAALSILVVVFLLAALVLSPWGTRLSLSIADKMFDELSVDYKSGGLSSQIQLSSISWQQVDANVVVHDVNLALDLTCLWAMSICVEQLTSGTIDVSIKPQNKEQVSDTQVTDKITLPFALSIDYIKLGRLNLLVEGQVSVSWQSLESRLQFYQTLEIEQLKIAALDLTLLAQSNDSQTASQDFDWANWQYQPLSQVDINLPISIDLKQADIAPLTITSEGNEAQVIKSVSLIARVEPKKISLSQLTVKHKIAEFTASAELALDGLLTHQLSLNAKVNQQPYGNLTTELSSHGDINQLTAQITSKGLVNANVKLNAELSSADLPLDILLNWQQLHWPLDGLVTDRVLESPQGQFSLKGDLNGLQITGQTEISGQNIPQATIELAARANHKGITLQSLVANTLGGQIVTSGSVNFADSLELLANMRLEHINPGVFDAAYQGDVNGQLDMALANTSGQWQGSLQNLNLTGTWRSYPLKVQGKVDFDEQANLKVETLAIKNGDNSLTLQGQFASDKSLDFDLQINASKLQQSIANVQGSLTANAQVSGSLEQPQLSYKLAGQQLSFADISIQQVQGSGEVVWNDVKPLNIELELQQVEGISNQIDELKVLLSGNAQSHKLVIDTTSNKTNLRAKITGSLFEDHWQGEWLEGEIESSYASLSLGEPFNIMANWQQQIYSISAHCWDQDTSDLCIKQAEFKDQQARWDIVLHDLNLLPLLHRLVPDFPPIESASLLSMTLKGDWVMDQLPQAQLHAELSPAVWRFKDKQTLALDLQTFKLDAQFSAQSVNLQSELSGPEIGSLKVALTGQAGDFADQLTRPIEGEFSLTNFNLAPFRILLPGLDKFEGMLAGTTAISGTLQKPLFNGLITLSEGALRGEGIPLVVNEVNQKFELLGDKAQITGSYLLGKGLGNIKGEIAWQPEFVGQIHINGDALEFDYQSMLRAHVSPNVDIRFSSGSVNVSGDVTIPYARFKLRELPADTISPSKDVILVEQQEDANKTESVLELALLVEVDPKQYNQVKLDAFGLTTDVRGKIRLENNKRGMSATGAMQLVNGRYKAYGQNLIIREGDITFNGPLERPFLNVEAIRDPKLTADEVIAGIRVEGAADNPKVEVFSEPVMEQQQSLSYMLSGRGLGQSSGDSQDTVLTNMLLGFGLGQSENMVSHLGEKLGFKDVNLDTSGQGDNTQLSLTGYVAPGVQLRYGVGVFDSVSEVAIRYELLPQLYIEAVSGLNNAIDIYYRFSVEGSENKKAQRKDSAEQ